MVRVKFCGISSIEEGKYAAGLGVHGLGFVFAESKRKITPQKATEISVNLPPFVGRGGVFVNENVEGIIETVEYCGLDFVQLHGDESSLYLEELSKKLIKGVDIIKAFRIKDEKSLNEIIGYKGEKFCSAYLLDSYSPAGAGGTGKSFNWEYFKEIKRELAKMPLILAGGLNPGNIYEALEVNSPTGVDVSSGIESREKTDENVDLLGRKDKERMREFMLNIWRWKRGNV